MTGWPSDPILRDAVKVIVSDDTLPQGAKVRLRTGLLRIDGELKTLRELVENPPAAEADTRKTTRRG